MPTDTFRYRQCDGPYGMNKALEAYVQGSWDHSGGPCPTTVNTRSKTPLSGAYVDYDHVIDPNAPEVQMISVPTKDVMENLVSAYRKADFTVEGEWPRVSVRNLLGEFRFELVGKGN